MWLLSHFVFYLLCIIYLLDDLLKDDHEVFYWWADREMNADKSMLFLTVVLNLWIKTTLANIYL